MTAVTLTPSQSKALTFLREHGAWMDLPALAEALKTSEQGAARTASSLQRRGLIQRTYFDRVAYRAAS